jgi:hypothetical protein
VGDVARASGEGGGQGGKETPRRWVVAGRVIVGTMGDYRGRVTVPTIGRPIGGAIQADAGCLQSP